MKTIFKKLILPIFLFAVLICSTLYFTYGNKNSMERVKAADIVNDPGGGGGTCKKVTCTRPAVMVYSCQGNPGYEGTCVCSRPQSAGYDTIPIHYTTYDSCSSYCTNTYYAPLNANYTGATGGSLTQTCPYGTLSGSKCSTGDTYYATCPGNYTPITASGHQDCQGNGTLSSGNCVKTISGSTSCPNDGYTWTPSNVVQGCASVGPAYCVSGLKYDGTQKTLVKDAGTGFSWKAGTTRTIAGGQNVYAQLDSEYIWSDGTTGTKSIECSIAPADTTITLSASSGTVVVGGSRSFTVSGSKEGIVTAAATNGKATVSVSGTTVTVRGSSVGTDTINVSLTPTDTNYAPATTSYSLTVNSGSTSYSSAEVPTNSLCKPNLVYTGAEQQIVSSTSGTGYTLSGYNQKDAGEYTITATLSSGYKWGGTESGTKEFKCKIDPKSVEVKWSNNVFPHDGQQHSQTPSATLVSGETIDASTGWTREYKKSDGTSLGTTAPSDEGSYTVTVTCKTVTGGQAKCSNYKFTKTTASFVIGNAMALNPTSGTINVGDTFTFELTNPAGGTVTWTSSKPAVATVNNSGVVTGVSAGTTVITATTSTGSVNATIVVEAGSTPSPDPEGIVQFEYDKYTCEVGKSITAVVRYSNVSNPPSIPTVTSSNTSVATVSIMTPRSCTSSTDTNCVTLDNDAIERCSAAGITELTVEKCISFYRSYYINIACKATGTTTVTAAFSDTLKAQTTVTANAAGSNVTVIFDANGGSLTNNGEPSSSLQITLTGTGTIAEALSNIIVAREGYTFDGWYTEDEGGVRYDDSVTFGAIGVEKLYAHWIENNGEKYTLTYDANGGTACSPATLEVPANTPWGELCKPSRKGYDFAGWFTSKTGGRKITESVLATGNMTVYAQWSKAAKDNANTGIVTPVIALLVVAIISTVTFLVVRKKRAQL